MFIQQLPNKDGYSYTYIPTYMHVYIYHADSPQNIKLSLFVRPQSLHTSLVPAFIPCLLYIQAEGQRLGNTCHVRWRQAGAQHPTTCTNTLHVRTKPENKLLTAKLSTLDQWWNLDHANVCLVREHLITKIKYACYLSVYPDPPMLTQTAPHTCTSILCWCY